MKNMNTKMLVLAIALSPAFSSALELTPQQMSNIKINTSVITEKQVASVINLNGTLRADQKRLYRIAPVVDGQVTELKVVEYARVRKGQVLARLHSKSLGEIQTAYLDALAKHEVAIAEYQRIKILREEGVVSESRLQDVMGQYKTTQAALDLQRRALLTAGVSASQIEDLSKQTDNISDYYLLSPANGVVLEVATENGQMLNAGDTAFRIADLSELWVDVRIPVASIQQIQTGNRVTVYSAAIPQQTFTGHLQALGSETDAGSQTISGRVVIDNRNGLLRPGMYVQAEIEAAPLNGMMVPENSVFRSGNDNYVFKVHGPGKFEPVKINIGEKANNMIQITSGITPGTEIVNSGVAELKAHWQYRGGM